MPARPRTRLSTLTGSLVPQSRDLEPIYADVSFDHSIRSIRNRRRPAPDLLLPGLLDLQVNGAFGIDVMGASAEDLLRLSNVLAREGTTAWLPTVITAPLDKIEECDEVIAEAIELQQAIEEAARRGSAEPIGARILGMHLEGPFISPRRLGAHPPLNLLPEGDALDRVLRLQTLQLITLAPEIEGALNAIPRLVARGTIVSIGHTDATYEQAVAALDAGATMFTHLFNAMPPFHHRAPGPIGAATADHHPRPTVMLIPDGLHVHPAALRLCRALRVAFVSDRVPFDDSSEPPKTLFGQKHAGCYRDGHAVRSANGDLIGSTISMLDAVRMMARELGGGLQGAERVTALNPSKALNLRDRGQITTRNRADLIVLDRDLNLKAVFIAGREVT